MMETILNKPAPSSKKNCVVIVAHPDDEILWVGGTILMHPMWNWLVVCLCRKSDESQALRFKEAMTQLNAEGVMGDLDDGPEQRPLDPDLVAQTILAMLPDLHYHLIVAHGVGGEYTRHLRHEETSSAVINLWKAGKIITKSLWLFAYEDGHGRYFPKAIQSANIYRPLPNEILAKKYKLILSTYGFDAKSWEAQTTPKAEAFRQFKSSFDTYNWLIEKNRKS